MKLLVVGGGPESGASCMRADQLGGAIGARVHTHPYSDPADADLRWCDAVIIVKRLKKRFNKWIARLLQTRKPVVWDALDFWKQPDSNALTPEEHIKACWKRKGELGNVKVLIAATARMARDCGGIYLPHHHRLGLSAADVRRTVRVVAYEGSDKYLGAWHEMLDTACHLRGWHFVLNPPSLTDADIVVALRGGEWDGWVCRQWKSGVKFGNSIAAGRPVIAQPCAAFAEMTPPGSLIETETDLARALDHWSDYDARLAAARDAERLVHRYHLETIAEAYRTILHDRVR